MHPLFLLFSFFFSSSWPPHQLSSSIPFISPNRRILHEPFVPLDSLPPSQPPNQPPLPPLILPSSTSSNPNPNPNPNPKHPFSTTTTPDPSSPFFPFYPYPPPPPPPPSPSFSTFASFPANISSLVIPHSLEPKKTSSARILSVAITAVACATVLLAISAFVYRRRKRYIGASNKTLRTETNSETETTNRNQRLRHSSSTTSEFLYLGTVVNSHRLEGTTATDSAGNGCRKMESPELQPLPRLSLRQHYSVPLPPPQAQMNEEHEEFFSPKGSSLCDSESSSVNGLGSWRVLPEQCCGELSSSSYSSGSPLANSSPGRAQLESSSRETRSLSSTTSMLSSPERNQIKNDALSDRTSVENEDALLQSVSNDSNGNRESLAQASSSAFSLASSPEKAMHCDSLDQSPRMSSFSERYRLSGLSSVPLSPTLLSSPERELSHTWNESEKFTNWVPQRKQHWEIPVFTIPTGPSHRVSLSLPPSLPTQPPMLPRRKQWAVPAISAHVVGQPVSRPPELTPPSRPFVLLNPTTNVSPVELPLSSQNSGGN